ncbi:MAG: two-component regulator propeller domain-containing protein [Segetibacter sp.]
MERPVEFKRYLEGSNVVNIFQDSTGVIWVATEFGLFRRNNKADNFSRFIEPGSELGTVNIVGILEDNKKNLWLGSLSGILKLNARRNETSIHGKKIRVLMPIVCLIWWGIVRMPENYYLEMLQVITLSFLISLQRISKPPKVILTDFKIAELSVKPGNSSPLNVPVEEAKEIKLNYKENVFSFDFAGIHYSSPEENRHLFMLDRI